MAAADVSALSLLALSLAAPAPLQEPAGARWIWGAWAQEQPRPEGERCFFRRSLALPAPPRRAVAHVACDNHFRLWVNGRPAGRGDSWLQATRLDLQAFLRAGDNLLALEARNDGAEAALLFFLELELEDGRKLRLDSDGAWLSAAQVAPGWNTGAAGTTWQPAREFGGHGTAPWLGIAWSHEVQFQALPGFRVERVAEGAGSLINLALDDAGRLLVSVESGGVQRLSDADGDGRFESAETYTDRVTYCQGLCWSRDSLFAVGYGPQGIGLYRVDEGQEPRFLGGFTDGGEHGPHAVVEGPGGFLYLAVGNHAQIRAPWSPASPYRWFYEGTLLPPYYDPRGHAVEVRAPGGTVVRVDRAGTEWTVLAGGFRNHYDLAFNRHGDLFTYDSDMEWDVGLPWYRPVRVLHVVSGGEYGWRTGSYNWPAWYPDSLPPAIEVGRGSPTGIAFYEGTQFPARFRGALLGCDWSQGQIYAFHLRPQGVSYTGTAEVLLRGQPLPVSDIAVAPGGSVLFCTGGRGTYGAVYRLSYSGPPEPPVPASSAPLPFPRFESAGQEALLQALRSGDRFVRAAAAQALEDCLGQPDAEKIVPILLTPDLGEALIPLARYGLRTSDAEACEPRLSSFRLVWKHASERDARLTALRALQLLLLDPDAAASPQLRAIGSELLHGFPVGDREVDRELGIVLAFLHPDGALERLLELVETLPSHEEQVHHAYCARAIRSGWSGEQKLRYLRWCQEAARWPGGFSFQGYIRSMQEDVEALLDPEERALWDREKEAARAAPNPLPSGGASHDFDTTLAFLQRAGRAPRRDPEEGARVFQERCAACHSYGGLGRGVGPELTTVRARFSTGEILEATLQPSRVVSDQYQAIDVWTRDGRVRTGFPLRDDASQLVLLLPDTREEEIAAADIRERSPSAVSLMPSGLLDGLTLEEVGDLFALFGTETAPQAPAASPWRSLFDGKTLEGWDGDPALWSVQDGAIVGRAEGRPDSSFLIFRDSFGDFRLEFDLLLEAGNSGLQFRARKAGAFVLHGYQADAGQTYWGSLYEEGGRGMLAQVPTEVWQPVLNEHGWNHFVVEARGDRLRIELNGQTTVELQDDAALSGRVGFQLHAGERTIVRLRNVRLRPLE
ncbi:MAG: DUF1080 domain-containing protein [Planctomycetota bacterium]|nr:MAG: DUF1080 domain-containing protein [Planctomycetota bacterium]